MIQRILAIIQKEFAQALRDRATMLIMLTMPLMQLVLFGYAISTQVRHIPTVVVDQSLDSYSRAYLNAMVNSQYFDVLETAPDQGTAVQEIDAGRVHAAIVIPPNFAEAVQRGSAQVLVLVDGLDLFTSQSAYSAANIIGEAYATKIVMDSVDKAGAQGAALTIPALNAHIRILYNPDLKDLWFIIPGMAAMLLQTQTIVLTAAAVVRERETGTIEQILVSPIRPLELMLGKIVPYLFVARFQHGYNHRPGRIPVPCPVPGKYLVVLHPIVDLRFQRSGPGPADLNYFTEPAPGAAVDHGHHDHQPDPGRVYLSSQHHAPGGAVVGQPVPPDIFHPYIEGDHHPRSGIIGDDRGGAGVDRLHHRHTFPGDPGFPRKVGVGWHPLSNACVP